MGWVVGSAASNVIIVFLSILLITDLCDISRDSAILRCHLKVVVESARPFF